MDKHTCTDDNAMLHVHHNSILCRQYNSIYPTLWKMATFDRHQGKDEVHDFQSDPTCVSRSLEHSHKQHSHNLVSIWWGICINESMFARRTPDNEARLYTLYMPRSSNVVYNYVCSAVGAKALSSAGGSVGSPATTFWVQNSQISSLSMRYSSMGWLWLRIYWAATRLNGHQSRHPYAWGRGITMSHRTRQVVHGHRWDKP